MLHCSTRSRDVRFPNFLVREVTLLCLHFYYRREVPFRCKENIKTLSIGPAPDKATQVSCRFSNIM